MVAYPALKSILSDLNQLAHAHLDKRCYNTRTQLPYRASHASKSMEPFFITLPEFKKSLAPSSRGLMPGGILTSRERKSTHGDVMSLQPASYCPRWPWLRWDRMCPIISLAAVLLLSSTNASPASTCCRGEETSRCRGS